MNLVISYFDPSAGSLLLQALVGGMGGFVVFGRYLWMRLMSHGPQLAAAPQSSEYEIPTSVHLQ